MRQYLEIIEEVLEKGTRKRSSRENLPPTISRFGIMKRFSLSEGFPLVTTRKISARGLIHELLMFLNGDTGIGRLHAAGVKGMWHDDAYRYYLESGGGLSRGAWEGMIGKDDLYRHIHGNTGDGTEETHGHTGKSYGHQWRRFSYEGPDGKTGWFDQVEDAIRQIREQPDGRYKVITAWHPGEVRQAALPPCHMLAHFNCRALSYEERVVQAHIMGIHDLIPGGDACVGNTFDSMKVPRYHLDCLMVQRSCDTAVGVPYNIASYALLTMIFAKMTGTVPGELVWVGNDVHLYGDHLEMAREQLGRRPREMPAMRITGEWSRVEDIRYGDFSLVGYNPHPAMKYPLHTGLVEDKTHRK